jgi:3-oxoacyl-[acyl-carrier protein] reductase
MSRFINKNILVVGGSSGISLALVKYLHEQKASVITASRRSSEELSRLDIPHLTIDVSGDTQQLANIPDTLHGLVYAPGTITLKPFPRLSAEDFQHDFTINVVGAVNVIQAALKSLKRAEGASVVLFSTVAARLGMNFHASIATSKSALEGLTVSLAAEFAPSRIRFNAIAPSLTSTPLANNLLSTEEKVESSNKRHPLGRIGQPDDLARMAAFLLSDEAGWITGQVLGVDGGLSTLRLI